jgi:hypothetical protein
MELTIVLQSWVFLLYSTVAKLHSSRHRWGNGQTSGNKQFTLLGIPDAHTPTVSLKCFYFLGNCQLQIGPPGKIRFFAIKGKHNMPLYKFKYWPISPLVYFMFIRLL